MTTKARTMLIYGNSGESKTSQLYFLAKYFYKLTKKPWRMIHLASGGYVPFEDSGMIQRGEIEVFDLTNLQSDGQGNKVSQFSAIKKLAEGYWIKNGKFAYTNEYRTLDWSNIGGYLIEGLTDISQMWLHYAAINGVGFKSSFVYSEDGVEVAGSQQGHYKIVQDELRKLFVFGFHLLPVANVFTTALIDKGEDDWKASVYGPASAGHAITDKIPSWFGDVIHVESGIVKMKQADGSIVEKPGKLGWFENHIDPQTGIKTLARSRCAPEHYEQLTTKYFPGGCVPLTLRSGLDKYVMAIEKIKQGDKIEERKEVTA